MLSQNLVTVTVSEGTTSCRPRQDRNCDRHIIYLCLCQLMECVSIKTCGSLSVSVSYKDVHTHPGACRSCDFAMNVTVKRHRTGWWNITSHRNSYFIWSLPQKKVISGWPQVAKWEHYFPSFSNGSQWKSFHCARKGGVFWCPEIAQRCQKDGWRSIASHSTPTVETWGPWIEAALVRKYL